MKTVVISILGTTLDRRGGGRGRWNKWRPTISMCQQEDLIVDRLELLFSQRAQSLANAVTEDIAKVSPETETRHHHLDFSDPWDFESVYSTLLDFSRAYTFNSTKERYLVHITTGTHVAQICLFLLTEAHYIPGTLLQTSPPDRKSSSPGHYQTIDLDLSKYDQIASRFQKEHAEGAAHLKSGIKTNNVQFNKMIEQLEFISVRSSEPVLLMGPTGAGKSQLAKRMYQLRKARGRLMGEFVVVNCATLRGENAMSALFGHKKSSFTGATSDRPGLLRQAHRGLLFLDEIGELGLNEQAMLLRAIEEKRFMPLGSDKEVSSEFQLIAGTNQDLSVSVEEGAFREDLLARIDLWTYTLPSLKERIEDLDPNIDYELERFSKHSNSLISFNKTARDRYVSFGKSADATWSGNFRDLNASIIRMATLANGGRITREDVDLEIERLSQKWQAKRPSSLDTTALLGHLLPKGEMEKMDDYDAHQLALVVDRCKKSESMADAGRRLFNKSRELKSVPNDSHRVRQILSKYGLNFSDIKANS